MALLSPGIQTSEIDLSVVASNAGSTNAAFGGKFERGFAGKAVNVNNVSELVSNFGKPSNDNFNQWYQAYYYLQYSSGLYISRAVDENGHWKETENTVKGVINTGKVELNGNPDDIYVGSVVKFGEDSEDEYKVKAIETPQEGQKYKAEIIIKNAQNTTDYKVEVNGQAFTFRSTDANAQNIARGLSNAINKTDVITDRADANKVIIEAVNVGVDVNIVIHGANMELKKIQEPQKVENYELVFDDETDFTDLVTAGQKIFVKGMSVNAFKFIPKDHKDHANLKPTNATEQIPFEALYLNEDDYDVKEGSISFPDNYKLKIMARTFGEYGNKIQVAIAREKDFDNPASVCFPGIALNNQFEYKALEANKEIALLVMENDVIIEKYIVSLDPAAKDYQGRSLFIEDVIR